MASNRLKTNQRNGAVTVTNIMEERAIIILSRIIQRLQAEDIVVALAIMGEDIQVAVIAEEVAQAEVSVAVVTPAAALVVAAEAIPAAAAVVAIQVVADTVKMQL